VANPGDVGPGLQGDDRAGDLGRAAADFGLAPAGFAAQGDDEAAVEDLDPAAAVCGVVAIDVQADDLGAPQAAGETDQRHRAIAQIAQRSAIERLEHRDDVSGRSASL
jgi:hypothetical protein